MLLELCGARPDARAKARQVRRAERRRLEDGAPLDGKPKDVRLVLQEEVVLGRAPIDAQAADPAYEARKFYARIEEHGAEPIIKPRKNARTGTIDARGRAIRWMLRHPMKWTPRYHRRPITESVNFAFKRKFGDRLWSHGLRSQRVEMGFRVLVHNSCLVCRSRLRSRVPRRDL